MEKKSTTIVDNRKRVLMVDDDMELLKIYGKFLSGKGFRVYMAGNVKAALSFLSHESVDCIVMDVMMPETDGFAAFNNIKANSSAPVLFLTGKAEEEDRVRGLTLGADDYIVKPCSLEELALRIQINIRRNSNTRTEQDVLEVPPLRISLLNQAVYYKENKVQLSKREYELLIEFVRHPGQTLTFENIGNSLNGSYLESDRQTVMMSVSRLRKKLDEYGRLGEQIETVWGKGYCFKGTR